MSLHCGIDFGTSNSALAVAKTGGEVELVLVEGQDVTLPSALFYPMGAPVVFGRQAIKSFIEGEEGRFMRSLKRILGTALMGQGTSVNGRNRKFEDILAHFICHIKSTTEAQWGQTLENVVMGRPVHFVDGNNAADLRAQEELEKIAKNTGFKYVEFQYEPVAAAFTHERKMRDEQLALVVDIGGGTSDFTIMRLSPVNMDKINRKDDILANTGIRIGGNDFDKNLSLAAFMPALGYHTTYGDPQKNMRIPVSPFFDMSEWSKINFLYTSKTRAQIENSYYQAHDKNKFGRFVKVLKEEAGHELLATVEESKINLTNGTYTAASLEFIEEGLCLEITRETFNEAVEKHVIGIAHAAEDCLQQAGIKGEDIDLVIMTGGTTEVPVLKDTIRHRFPNAAISEENKLSSVALGLGYDSIRRFGVPHSSPAPRTKHAG